MKSNAPDTCAAPVLPPSGGLLPTGQVPPLRERRTARGASAPSGLRGNPDSDVAGRAGRVRDDAGHRGGLSLTARNHDCRRDRPSVDDKSGVPDLCAVPGIHGPRDIRQAQMTPASSPVPVPTERHPFQPFLPPHARLLMLGSFPPQRKRWCMDFYYPNFNNDMWRIMGHIFHDDRDWFVDVQAKCFKKGKIVEFLLDKGIALYDTASVVRRLQDNASDSSLEVVVPTDLPRLLGEIPRCTAVAATGQKAADVLCDTFHVPRPAIGCFSPFTTGGRELRLYRMPSSSRAYPLKMEGKAVFYRNMLEENGLL